MPDLGIHAAMGTTVRKVGNYTIGRAMDLAFKPTFTIYDDEGTACGQIFVCSLRRGGGIVLYDIEWSGPDLIAIGQFLNDLNEHYKKG